MKFPGNILLVLLVFVLACGSENNKPQNLIPEDKFNLILEDVLMADASVSYELGQEYEKVDSLHGYYKKVFLKHNITREAFKNSLAYYSRDLEKFRHILEKVNNRLQARQSEFEKEHPLPVPEKVQLDK